MQSTHIMMASCVIRLMYKESKENATQKPLLSLYNFCLACLALDGGAFFWFVKMQIYVHEQRRNRKYCIREQARTTFCSIVSACLLYIEFAFFPDPNRIWSSFETQSLLACLSFCLPFVGMPWDDGTLLLSRKFDLN